MKELTEGFLSRKQVGPAYSFHVSRKQMVSDGFDTLSHIMEIYMSKPDEDNVSDDIAEALMKSVIQNLRTAIANPQDYTAISSKHKEAVYRNTGYFLAGVGFVDLKVKAELLRLQRKKAGKRLTMRQEHDRL